MTKYHPFLMLVESGSKHHNSPFLYPGNVSNQNGKIIMVIRISKQKLIDGKFLRVVLVSTIKVTSIIYL